MIYPITKDAGGVYESTHGQRFTSDDLCSAIEAETHPLRFCGSIHEGVWCRPAAEFFGGESVPEKVDLPAGTKVRFAAADLSRSRVLFTAADQLWVADRDQWELAIEHSEREDSQPE